MTSIILAHIIVFSLDFQNKCRGKPSLIQKKSSWRNGLQPIKPCCIQCSNFACFNLIIWCGSTWLVLDSAGYIIFASILIYMGMFCIFQGISFKLRKTMLGSLPSSNKEITPIFMKYWLHKITWNYKHKKIPNLFSSPCWHRNFLRFLHLQSVWYSHFLLFLYLFNPLTQTCKTIGCYSSEKKNIYCI